MELFTMNVALSDDDTYIVEDIKENMYEYHIHTGEVLIVNRYIGDEGDCVSSPLANQIRSFCKEWEKRRV